MLGKTHMAVGVAAGLLVLQPKNLQELLTVHGIGESKAKTFGKEILKIIEM